jgi:hypothetical protein
VQRLDAVADGRDHALDLVVLAFDQRQPQQRLVDDLGPFGLADLGRALELAGRLAFRLLQLHAGHQLLRHRRCQRMLAARLVDLGHMVLGGGQLVDQRAVVGQQQQAGRVLIQPADGLDAALAQRRRQQAHDAGVVLGLLRALVARRLVQQHQRLVEVRPDLAGDLERQAGGVELGPGLVDDRAADLHLAMRDQSGAQAPGAETLGEKDLVESLGLGHARIVAARCKPQANTPAVSCMRWLTSPRWCSVSPHCISMTVSRLK